MTRCGAALRRKPAETRFGVAAEKSWGKLERSNDLFRESSDGGSFDGGAATHCAPPEFSYECESRAFLLGAGGWVERYVSRRNTPRLDFLRYNRITKIPCATELSQAEQRSGSGVTCRGAALLAVTVHGRDAPATANYTTTKGVMVQFAVAAVSDRRNILNQKTAVRDRRYKESNCTTTTKGREFTTSASLAYNQCFGAT